MATETEEEEAWRAAWLAVDDHLKLPDGRQLFIADIDLSKEEAWQLSASPYHDGALVPLWKITQTARYRMQAGRPPRDTIVRRRKQVRSCSE